jgi:hypothetical protein
MDDNIVLGHDNIVQERLCMQLILVKERWCMQLLLVLGQRRCSLYLYGKVCKTSSIMQSREQQAR